MAHSEDILQKSRPPGWTMGALLGLVFLLVLVGSWSARRPAHQPRFDPGTSSADATTVVVHAEPAVPAPATGEAPPPDAAELEEARLRLEWLALQEEHAQLTRQHDALQRQLTSLLQWMIDNLKGTVPLPQDSEQRLAFEAMTGDYRLDPEVAAYLHITPDETAMINDAFAYGHAAMRSLIGDHLTIQQPAANQVVLEIAPHAASGAGVEADIHGALEATLGPDRFRRFLDVAGNGLANGFSRFGDGLHSLSFEWVLPDDQNGPPQLRVRDGWLLETDERRIQMITTESTFDEWPAEYGDWIEWMPEGFAPPTS